MTEARRESKQGFLDLYLSMLKAGRKNQDRDAVMFYEERIEKLTEDLNNL